MSLLSWLLVILAGLSLAAMVVSITIANRSAREARSTIFPIVREEETVRARRARIVSSVTGVIAAIMAGAFFLSGQLSSLSIPGPQLLPEFVANDKSPVKEQEIPIAPSETPLPPTQEQQTPAPSQVAMATIRPSAAATLSATVTSTPVPPTLTPAPPSPSPTVAPSKSRTSMPPSPPPTTTSSPILAPDSVQIGPIAFTTEISDRREPISPTTIFSETVNRVYAAFPYSGMQDGLTWTQIWYFNDVEFSRGEETWGWGSADRSYVFTKPVGAGNYRLELYVNDDLVASGAFTIRGPIAVGGPETLESPGTPESSETPETPGTPGSPESTATAESP